MKLKEHLDLAIFSDKTISGNKPNFSKIELPYGLKVVGAPKLSTEGIFEVLHIDIKADQGFKGVYKGYSYECTRGYYRTKRKSFEISRHYIILSIELEKQLPHIFLDVKTNDYNVSNVPILFDDKQRHELEGSFPKKYDLFFPNNEQIHALSILTPDVMSDIMEQAGDVEIEFVGTKVHIISPSQRYNAAAIQSLFAAADAILDNWQTKKKSWKGVGKSKLSCRIGYASRVGNRRFNTATLFYISATLIFLALPQLRNLNEAIVKWGSLILLVGALFYLAKMVKGRKI